jgi:hypothetical protein
MSSRGVWSYIYFLFYNSPLPCRGSHKVVRNTKSSCSTRSVEPPISRCEYLRNDYCETVLKIFTVLQLLNLVGFDPASH